MKTALSCLLLSLLALPAQATSASQVLQPAQIRLLKSLQVPVAVPGYVPADCRIHKVVASQSMSGPGGGPGYEIHYFCEQSDGFTLEGASGGFGGPSGDKLETVWNPVFGKIRLNLFVVGGQFKIKSPYFFSDWTGKGPLYFSLRSGEDGGDQLSLPEARKVLQGLTFLK